MYKIRKERIREFLKWCEIKGVPEPIQLNFDIIYGRRYSYYKCYVSDRNGNRYDCTKIVAYITHYQMSQSDGRGKGFIVVKDIDGCHKLQIYLYHSALALGLGDKVSEDYGTFTEQER